MSETRGHRIEALFGVKGSWVMTFEGDSVVLAPRRGDGVEYEFARHEVGEFVTLKDPAVGGPCLIAKSDKRMGFRLSRRAAAAYAEWRGPLRVADLRKALKASTSWAIPIGILYLVGSLPIAGDDPLPLDVTGLVLGGGLVAIGIVGRLLATRWIFVIDAVWWVVFGTWISIGVVQGDSPWWLALVALAVMLGFEQIQWFRRFPPDRELVPASPPAVEDDDPV
jgi:hypothetical protein